MRWNPFKRRKPPAQLASSKPLSEASALPTEVIDALESASFLTRSTQDDDGLPRVLVGLPGRRFYADNLVKNVAEQWPELNAAQQRRACRWLSARVAIHLRAGIEASQERPQRWRDWKPSLHGEYWP